MRRVTPCVRRRPGGLTLVELIVVVAIVAILSAIAVSHFAEAGMRTKISRVKADFRTVFTAMEMYRMDQNKYVSDAEGRNWASDMKPFTTLTTPVAYLTQVPLSPLDMEISGGAGNFAYWGNASVTSDKEAVYYHVVSSGPDGEYDLYFDMLVPHLVATQDPRFRNKLYDPTNGTVSRGDLHFSNRGMSK